MVKVKKETVKGEKGVFDEVVERLGNLHGMPERSANRSVLSSLIRTMLSQNTTDVTSKRAFEQLEEKFPDWNAILSASLEDIAKPIKCCGLADIRASRIKGMIEQIKLEKGEVSLEYVRDLTDDEIKKELTRFKGVGPKTVACVLMFTLNRAEFPVDTHVWRIAKNFGWVPKTFSREKTYAHLNKIVPDHLKFDLHCLLVKHGKHCLTCAKNGRPRLKPHVECPLRGVKRGRVVENESKMMMSPPEKKKVKKEKQVKVKKEKQVKVKKEKQIKVKRKKNALRRTRTTTRGE
eukprot:g6444.t1